MTNDVAHYRFHVSIHPLPSHPKYDSPRVVREMTVAPLRITPEAIQVPFAISFEEAAERLERLPRMFLEPDGAFVWVSPSHGPNAELDPSQKWQVDGVLYDREQRLMFVDLKGECSQSAWTQLLTAMGSEQTPLMFQLVREAIFLDEPAFRTVCAVREGPSL